jgi:hypothetical protein
MSHPQRLPAPCAPCAGQGGSACASNTVQQAGKITCSWHYSLLLLTLLSSQVAGTAQQHTVDPADVTEHRRESVCTGQTT